VQPAQDRLRDYVSEPVASENPVHFWLAVTGESEHDRRMIAIGLLFVAGLRTRVNGGFRLAKSLIRLCGP
jgi:hypothetical protein